MKQSIFRNIRRKLLNEGKLVRYLTYAIGEVVLIIVGILFALKINDLNEDRKAQDEFDAYIVQLKEDVKTAIENMDISVTTMDKFVKSCEYSLSFLELSEYGPEQLTAFENGLSHFGNYPRPQVHVGLLGQLMSGNMGVIVRNASLAQKTMTMESEVERILDIQDHCYDQIDLSANRLNQFYGRGSNAGGRPPVYDLEALKSSAEFTYTNYDIISNMVRITVFSNTIREFFVEFLAVLEEYETP